MWTIKLEHKPKMFWLWLCRFSYRRLAHKKLSTIPVGIPGMRDPQHKCTMYAPRPPIAEDWKSCQGDGHYLCAECAYFKPEDELSEEEDSIPVIEDSGLYDAIVSSENDSPKVIPELRELTEKNAAAKWRISDPES